MKKYYYNVLKNINKKGKSMWNKKYGKKIVGVILAVSMVFGIAACGDKKDRTNDSGTQSTKIEDMAADDPGADAESRSLRIQMEKAMESFL